MTCNTILLTSLQKEVIIGTMLGDASIERTKLTHNSRIRFDQTYPNHLSYIIHLYNIFENIVNIPPKIYQRKLDKRTNKIYSSIAFKSLNIESLNYYYDIFYKYDPNHKKKK